MEQRLLAQAIACEQHAPRRQIGNGKREHAIQALRARIAILFVGVNNRFGIGLRPELMPLLDQVVAQLAVVVDLAVEDDPHRAVLVGHRLITAGAIDDRETTMTERHPGGLELRATVRTAVIQAVGHGFDGVGDVGRQVAFEADYAADSAHSLDCSKPVAMPRRPKVRRCT